MLPLIRPFLRFEEVEDDLRAVLASGILTGGPYVAAFEEELARSVGVEHAVTTTSATTAMHLVLAALEIGPGDEVLVSDFTFPATGNVVVERGALPVLVDCAPGRFTIGSIEASITPRTKAVIVVDPFGQPALDHEQLEVAHAHDLVVIEDAACGLGSSRGGVPCGRWPGVPGCFSFHPRKVVTTGEGGAITTDDGELAARVRLLRSHGGQRGPEVGLEFVAHGFNYRMSEVQAVLGLAQLRRLDDIRNDRIRTAARYEALLDGVEGVELITRPRGDVWSYQSFVVLVDDRDRVVHRMRDGGIETTLGTYAMHAHPAFAHLGHVAGDLPESYDRQQRSLTLPLLPAMEERDIERVVRSLASAVLGR